MTTCLHIGHPSDQYAYGLTECINRYVGGGRLAALCGDWSVVLHCYDKNNSLDARDFCSNVMARPGPVLLLQPIKTGTLADIRGRLHGRIFLLAAEAYEETALHAELVRLKQAHDNGEPFLPIDLVVGLLIIRKLEREHFWGGKDKGYMWLVNIPNGRGVDPKFAHRVSPVLNMLELNHVLIKKTSNGKPKFALNPERKTDVFEILRQRNFADRLGEILRRNQDSVSANELKILDDYVDPRSESQSDG